MNVKVINKSKHVLPHYSTIASAGMDLRANIEDSISLKPLERTIVKTGIFIELPVGFEAQVRPRSGLAFKNGITVLNSPGTIDADYRGELKVLATWIGQGDNFTVSKGERVAQLLFAQVPKVTIVETSYEELGNTERGSGGFGSSGQY